MNNSSVSTWENVSEEKVVRKMKIIRERMPEIFAGDSESYRQKLVYTLLNIARSGDMHEFLWTLLRHLNAKKDSPAVKEVVGVINELYQYSSKFFEKWAYSVIMGIMETKRKTTEGKEG